MLKRALLSGRVNHEAEGVYGFPGWPDSWYRRLWRACLTTGPHAVVAFETAAALHAVTGFRPGRIVLMTPHGDHHRHGLCEVRQCTDLSPDHIVVVDGLRVTSVVRTLFDLSAVAGVQRLALAIEDAHITGQCRLDVLQAFFEELRRPGKRGMKKLGRVLAERGPGYVPPQSWLQRRLVNVLVAGGLPTPQLEVQLPWRRERESRADALYDDETRILMEADGRRWHTRVDQMAEDRRRDREAQNHGYRPYRFVYQELRYEAEMVVETIREARAA
ncbi:MAG: DUF559 domain-containing protein [Acidimicrobiia bacterium]|nr:DUF559 domain-containing protein [Acidimicrobiia bacterium]